MNCRTFSSKILASEEKATTTILQLFIGQTSKTRNDRFTSFRKKLDNLSCHLTELGMNNRLIAIRLLLLCSPNTTTITRISFHHFTRYINAFNTSTAMFSCSLLFFLFLSFCKAVSANCSFLCFLFFFFFHFGFNLFYSTKNNISMDKTKM